LEKRGYSAAGPPNGRLGRRVDLRLADDYSGVVETATASLSNATSDAMFSRHLRDAIQGNWLPFAILRRSRGETTRSA
jgi:hypothetical protein